MTESDLHFNKVFLASVLRWHETGKTLAVTQSTGLATWAKVQLYGGDEERSGSENILKLSVWDLMTSWMHSVAEKGALRMTPGFLAKTAGRKMLPFIEKSRLGIGSGGGSRAQLWGP